MKWEKVNLGEIAEFKNGLNFNKDQYGKGVKYISVADFQDYFSAKTNGLAELKEDFISPSYFLKEGDILFVRSNGNKELVGRNLFIEESIEPITFSGFCIRARFINENVLPKFYAYLFKSKFFRNTLSANAGGTNINNLNQGILSNLKIPVPPLPTQRKIAGILSAYDDLIENNNKRIKLLEQKAFLRYKQIVRDEKLEEHILSDFGNIITGKTPSTAISDYFGDDVPFIKTPDMHNQIFIEKTDQMLSESGAKSQEKKFLPPLSLCISCIGTAGVVGITSKLSQTNQQINSIVFDEPKNVYFFYALMSQMKEQLDALGSNGSTFTNVNKNKFENMEVLVPSQKVLEKFAQEFEAPFNMILNLQKQNAKLREARDILLPKLMNGEIEV